MISALSWVSKGKLKAVPDEAEPLSKEEIQELLKNEGLYTSSREVSEDEEEEGDMDLDDTKSAEEVSQALAAANVVGKNSSYGTKDVTDGLGELNMDAYDDEDNDISLFARDVDIYYPSNELDPYLQKVDVDDEDEIEDAVIKPSDAVIICARNDDDICIYEELEDGDSNLYPHHDIILPAFPLCTAWLDYNLKGGDKGNFIAVGSMEPAIEIWDLDLINEVHPCLVLGGIDTEKEKKKKKKKEKKGKKISIKYKNDSHTDSVLGLAWNKKIKKYLASASADMSVKIWDVDTGKCFHTRKHHTDKVQAVAWNWYWPNALLSGSFDHSVVLTDMRFPSHTGIKSAVTADVESIAWDPYDEHAFIVSLEDGTIQGYDLRGATSNPALGCKPCFTLHAHDKAVCTISYNPSVPKMLATGSTDKAVKLWDLSNNQPSCVASKNPKAGALFSISFSDDSPFLLAMGGSKGELQVWDTLTDIGVARKFGKYTNRKVEPVQDDPVQNDPAPKI
ncbi:hypothetical protein GIB67_004875 [Kingdonia uniflora]|uniref:Anaphase-promoting complex subunit 4-like WD40 domain-containing protein n=1 Tax=Kingdonia uniflora TaxID=39325 RepID=A0A7J7LNS3_9MAGN|nr:hypothetical protein GIB67_004875 [Kingdonia uniflora]